CLAASPVDEPPLPRALQSPGALERYGLEPLPEFLHRLRPLAGILAQAFENDLLELPRDLRRDTTRRRNGCLLNVRHHDLHRIASFEHWLTRHEPVGHAPERVDIGSTIDNATARTGRPRHMDTGSGKKTGHDH